MSVFPKPRLVTGSTIIRPADTTPYASGDLVANSTTAGSVTPFTFPAVVRQTGYRGVIQRAGLFTSLALLANGTFRLHLFTSAPTVVGGDNAALSVATNLDKHLGYIEMVLAMIGTPGSIGWGAPPEALGKPAFISGNSAGLWGLLEARAAYVPASGQTFTPLLEVAAF